MHDSLDNLLRTMVRKECRLCGRQHSQQGDVVMWMRRAEGSLGQIRYEPGL